MVLDVMADQAALTSFRRLDGMQRRIADQRALVASFSPESRAHRTATEVLLLLLDSAHAIAEARSVLALARRASAHPASPKRRE